MATHEELMPAAASVIQQALEAHEHEGRRGQCACSRGMTAEEHDRHLSEEVWKALESLVARFGSGPADQSVEVAAELESAARPANREWIARASIEQLKDFAFWINASNPLLFASAAEDVDSEDDEFNHAFIGVAGHPDDDECTYRADGTDETYCGESRWKHSA